MILGNAGDQILAELKPRVEKLTAAHRQPGLAVILVGDDPASEIYVCLKVKTCAELGIYSEKIARAPPFSRWALPIQSYRFRPMSV